MNANECSASGTSLQNQAINALLVRRALPRQLPAQVDDATVCCVTVRVNSGVTMLWVFVELCVV